MKATGITRRIDDLGRIVLPKEMRRTMGIEPGTPIEIFTEDDTVILQKYEEKCIICGSTKDIVEYKGKKTCRDCIEGMRKL